MVKPDPEAAAAEAALVVRVKKALRGRIGQLRRALPEAVRQERSQRVVERVVNHPWFRAARGVALFWPMHEHGEVDVRGLDQVSRNAGKRVYYPFMQKTDSGFRTGFRLVADTSELALRGHRFLEPSPDAAEASGQDIDFIVVPALAAALTGHRIGSGSGFYDATLPDFPGAKTCVVVFGFQMVAEVPLEPHDQRCDLVCSDEEIVEVTGS